MQHIYLYTCTSTFCMAYLPSVLGKSLLQFQRGTEINEPGFLNSNEKCYHIYMTLYHTWMCINIHPELHV